MEMRLLGMQMETTLFGMSTTQLFVTALVSEILQLLFGRLLKCLEEFSGLCFFFLLSIW